ncbi:hypothetical protein [Kitasatospora cinereorecta]|uniref:bpX5 domain-containing protein n=1 Tax=Kitasatospora cinereorecta TaxID=285560 RepID=UPI0031F7C082
MTAVPPQPLRWERREPPLPAAAVAATDPAAIAALAAATLARLADGISLRAAADAATLLVLGEPEDLPWADGARYLAWEAGALVPTTARPHPATTLWRDALAPDPTTRLALLPDAALVFTPPTAAPDRAALARLAAPTGTAPGGLG